MNKMSKCLLAGAAGVAAVAAATPASAQNAGNVLGSILNNVLGYGQYPYGNYGYGQQNYQSSQVAVDQCARMVEARLNNMAYNNGYNRWEPNRNPYNGWAVQGQARVLGVDNVEVKKYGRLKITGVATSGNRYSNQYGYGNYRYNSNYGTPDLRFACKAEANGRVYDVDLDRMNYYRRGY